MTISFRILLLILLTLAVASCSRQSTNSPQENTEEQLAIPDRSLPSDQEAVQFENPAGTWWFECRSWMLEEFMCTAVFQNRALKGGAFPKTYEELLSSGLIPFIFRNRYTGEPVKSTKQYSPGDIFYEVDYENDVWRFWKYQGEQDIYYDPAATDGQFLPWAGGPAGYYTTDGKTIRTEMHDVGVATISAFDERNARGMPEDDDALPAMLVLSSGVNRLMFTMSQFVDQVPATLDDYIDMIGEKNPAAWTNPYTGEPIKEVEWVPVPLYVDWNQASDPIEGLYPPAEQGTQTDDLAGNYSYTVKPSPAGNGELRAYAQFYFRQPDGRIAALLAVGMNKNEFGSVE